jgi:hypothetical protein
VATFNRGCCQKLCVKDQGKEAEMVSLGKPPPRMSFVGKLWIQKQEKQERLREKSGKWKVNAKGAKIHAKKARMGQILTHRGRCKNLIFRGGLGIYSQS